EVGRQVDLGDAATRHGYRRCHGGGRHTGAAVEYQWHARALAYLGKPLEVQIDGRAVPHAVHGADRDGQRVDLGLAGEAARLLRVGVRARERLVGLRERVRAQGSYLTLDRYAVHVPQLDDTGGESDVLVERQVGRVDHHGAEGGVYRAPDDVQVVGVVQVQRHGDAHPLGSQGL